MPKKQTHAAVYLDPSTLVPWDRNPRLNEKAVKEIRASIERFGFGAPIIARKEDSRVIAGHTRLKAAMELKLKSVPVRLLDLSEKEADALALADNRLGELASWDPESLAKILSELDVSSATDGLGWDSDEIEQILASNDAFDEMDFDEAEPPMQYEAPPYTGDDGSAGPRIRMVQLFLDDETIGPFMSKLGELAKRLGTKNVSDTVLKLVEEA